MKSRIWFAFFIQACLLVFLVASARSQPAPKAAAAKKPPSESARIKDLPDEERQWLTEFVAVIILDDEKKTFLDLAASYQREVFKEDFWQRREQPGLPIPLGPGYRYRYQELWELANSKYDGWREDAGRMVLRWGEPPAILTPHCGGSDVLRDVEVWTYNNVGPNGRSTVRYIFYRPYPTAPQALELSTARSTPSSESAARKFQAFAGTARTIPDPCPCDDRCEVYKAYLEISRRQGNGAGGAVGKWRRCPASGRLDRGLERLRNRWATTSNPGEEIGVEARPREPADASASTPHRRPNRATSSTRTKSGNAFCTWSANTNNSWTWPDRS